MWSVRLWLITVALLVPICLAQDEKFICEWNPVYQILCGPECNTDHTCDTPKDLNVCSPGKAIPNLKELMTIGASCLRTHQCRCDAVTYRVCVKNLPDILLTNTICGDDDLKKRPNIPTIPVTLNSFFCELTPKDAHLKNQISCTAHPTAQDDCNLGKLNATVFAQEIDCQDPIPTKAKILKSLSSIWQEETSIGYRKGLAHVDTPVDTHVAFDDVVPGTVENGTTETPVDHYNMADCICTMNHPWNCTQNCSSNPQFCSTNPFAQNEDIHTVMGGLNDAFHQCKPNDNCNGSHHVCLTGSGEKWEICATEGESTGISCTCNNRKTSVCGPVSCEINSNEKLTCVIHDPSTGLKEYHQTCSKKGTDVFKCAIGQQIEPKEPEVAPPPPAPIRVDADCDCELRQIQVFDCDKDTCDKGAAAHYTVPVVSPTKCPDEMYIDDLMGEMYEGIELLKYNSACKGSNDAHCNNTHAFTICYGNHRVCAYSGGLHNKVGDMTSHCVCNKKGTTIQLGKAEKVCGAGRCTLKPALRVEDQLDATQKAQLICRVTGQDEDEHNDQQQANQCEEEGERGDHQFIQTLNCTDVSETNETAIIADAEADRKLAVSTVGSKGYQPHKPKPEPTGREPICSCEQKIHTDRPCQTFCGNEDFGNYTRPSQLQLLMKDECLKLHKPKLLTCAKDKMQQTIFMHEFMAELVGAIRCAEHSCASCTTKKRGFNVCFPQLTVDTTYSEKHEITCDCANPQAGVAECRFSQTLYNENLLHCDILPNIKDRNASSICTAKAAGSEWIYQNIDCAGKTDIDVAQMLAASRAGEKPTGPDGTPLPCEKTCKSETPVWAWVLAVFTAIFAISCAILAFFVYKMRSGAKGTGSGGV